MLGGSLVGEAAVFALQPPMRHTLLLLLTATLGACSHSHGAELTHAGPPSDAGAEGPYADAQEPNEAASDAELATPPPVEDAGVVESGTPAPRPAQDCDRMVLEDSWPFDLNFEHSDSLYVGTTPLIADLHPGGSSEALVVTSGGSHAYVRIVDFDARSTTTLDTSQYIQVEPGATPAIADLDGDGVPEIVVVGRRTAPWVLGFQRPLVAFRLDGSLFWHQFDQRRDYSFGDGGVAVAVGDLEGDGIPEVALGNRVYDGLTGALKWRAVPTREVGYAYNQANGPISCIADLDGDGRSELIAGHTVFEADGRERWNADVPDGFCAVADVLDEAAGREVILVSNGYVRILRAADGEVLWMRQLEGWLGAAAGGPPTVADFDGDGRQEFAVAHGGAVGIYDPSCGASCVAPGLLRARPISAGPTGGGIGATPTVSTMGVTAFDFNLDGRSELVWHDKYVLGVDAGFETATYLASAGTRPGTQMPVVADLDHDNEAEIIAPLSAVQIGARRRTERVGLAVYGHAGHGWPAARTNWVRHAFADNDEAPTGTDAERLETFRATQALAREGAGNCITW